MKSKKIQEIIKNRLVGRRQFLIGGGATLVLPPLISLMPRSVAAQVQGQKVLRAVFYAAKWGIDESQFFPSGVADLQTVEGAGIRYKPLSQFSGPLSRVIDSSFSAVYPYMNLIKGLAHTGGKFMAHNRGALSGIQSGAFAPTAKSIDLILRDSPNFYVGAKPRHRSLIIASDGHTINQSYEVVNGRSITSNYLHGDGNLFTKLFANVFNVGEAANPTAIDQGNNLIVDRVYGDLKSLEKSTRLSQADKFLLERYVASVHDVQGKLQLFNSGYYRCNKPTIEIQQQPSPSGDYTNGNSVASFDTMFKNYIELIKIAFLCDLTRVVYIGNSIWGDNNMVHGLHHEAPSSEVAADRQRWGISKMKDMAEAFKGHADTFGSGNLLDNSIILCTNELGAWRTSHSVRNMPVVAFGRAGGFFNTGYFADCNRSDTVNAKDGPYGRPYKQILQSILLALGIPKSEYVKYGNGTGFGEFKNDFVFLNRTYKDVYAPFLNTHNDAIPFLTKGA